MDYDDHRKSVEREVAALAAAFTPEAMGARVPSCPAWTVRELAHHVGEFTGLWTHVLCEATGRPKTPYSDVPDDDGAVAGWYAELGGHLVAELAATPSGAPAWTWVPDDQSSRFIARRCANELAVHRFDAQLATGGQEPIEAALAADGIEEVFVLVRAWGNPPHGSGRTLHVHAAEGDEWTIAMRADGLDVRREHSRSDLALRGAVSDLQLLLFRRPPIGPVERLGDEAVLEDWYREFTFG